MGNQSKRHGLGKTSELVVSTTMSAPAMLAAMVHDAGGAVSISYDVLAKVADEILLHVTTTPEGVQLTTTLKPIIRPQIEVPEGPAGIVDLESLTAAAAATGQVAQPAATAEDDDGWDYPGSDGEGVEPVAGELEAYGEDDDDPEG